MVKRTSCFDLFGAEVVPAHWAGVERQANIARAAVLAAHQDNTIASEDYARGCRAAHALTVREAKRVFKAAWPGWAAARAKEQGAAS